MKGNLLDSKFTDLNIGPTQWKTLTEISRILFDHLSRHHGQVNLTLEINHHRWRLQQLKNTRERLCIIMREEGTICSSYYGIRETHLWGSPRFEYSVSEHVLKLNIQKTKVMASGPITSWKIDGETMETVRDFLFLGSKITADGDCSHEIKRCLLLGRKAVTNLNRMLKSRDITLLTKVCLVKAMVFPVVMHGLRVGSWRKLSAKELMLLNCGVGEDSWESLGLQRDPTSQS